MEYNDNIDLKDTDWIEILHDPNLMSDTVMQIFQITFQSENHEIIASELAEALKLKHHVTVNQVISNFGKKVAEVKKVNPPEKKMGLVLTGGIFLFSVIIKKMDTFHG